MWRRSAVTPPHQSFFFKFFFKIFIPTASSPSPLTKSTTKSQQNTTNKPRSKLLANKTQITKKLIPLSHLLVRFVRSESVPGSKRAGSPIYLPLFSHLGSRFLLLLFLLDSDPFVMFTLEFELKQLRYVLFLVRDHLIYYVYGRIRICVWVRRDEIRLDLDDMFIWFFGKCSICSSCVHHFSVNFGVWSEIGWERKGFLCFCDLIGDLCWFLWRVNSAINDNLFINCPFLGFLWYRTMTKMPLQKLVQEETKGPIDNWHVYRTLKDNTLKIKYYLIIQINKNEN